ncbi:AMP-binding protein [Pseudomonas citronellolis]|uniref:AMP-binding protein n=1 Tax=Pseudomonas citronellolis TaxID=53408 RepID=UPI00264A1569|nr:AMP-binding protein [Pseudomonas citronellolis]MDN6875429.1 AMP-binding protein [Pseudomonas citronellolis]
MKGFDFNQLPLRIARFTHSVIEGPVAGGTRAQVMFSEVYARACRLAKRLHDSGLQRGEVLALRSNNCIEWVVWDLAAVINGHVLHVFLEDAADPTPEEVFRCHGYRLFVDALAGEMTVQGLQSLDDNAEITLRKSIPITTANPDLFSMIYSSGSSGFPKGLLVSRRGTEYLVDQFLHDYDLDETDRSLIFMPLSNFQQRMSMYAFLWSGSSFSLTDLDNAFKSVRNFSPTYMVAPPSFYEQALERFRGAPGTPDSLKNGLGGRLRFVHVGMAPSSGDPIGRFASEGIAMYEAYGVTEAGMIAWNTPRSNRPGSVGKPVNPLEVFLDDKGEIIIKRKYPLCLGYFDASQCDQDTTFRSGEIATGDLGAFDKDGFLYLKGRCKNLVILETGESFLPEPLEQRVKSVANFACCLVMFDLPRNTLQCYLVPRTQVLDAATAEMVRAAINAALDRSLDIEVISSTIKPSIDAGTLTRNMKIRRGPMHAWLKARLAEGDKRFKVVRFAAEMLPTLPKDSFITHAETIRRIQGNSYLVVRITDHALQVQFSTLLTSLRDRLQSAGSYDADQTLLPAIPHLTLGEWRGVDDPYALAELIRSWAGEQPPLTMVFEGLRTLDSPTNLVLAPVMADDYLRNAMQSLREASQFAGIPCHEPISVEKWLFHVSLAHCPELSPAQWKTLIQDLDTYRFNKNYIVATQVDLVHYRDHLEWPAQTFNLLQNGIKTGEVS